MRILSFNANGIRSAARKGFFDWLPEQQVDLLCLQETRAPRQEIEAGGLIPAGYRAWLREASTRKGYSGVGIYSREQPDAVVETLGWPAFDDEGRFLELRFGKLSVVSLYLPSGSSSEERQQFKFRCMDWLLPILDGWLASGRDYVLCGDWNIVHTRKDIRNWSSNQKNSGCLPEERAWLDLLFQDRGWVDSYRQLRPEGEDYTWWSQRGQARANNVGWRIDYQVVSPGLAGRLRDCRIHPAPKFSDHAPYQVDYQP